jgi:hypothetical protein
MKDGGKGRAKDEDMKKIVSRFVVRDIILVQRFSNYAPPPPGGVLLVFRGGGVVYMRDVFILNEVWAQHKIYF